jgi:hypothetical protein
VRLAISIPGPKCDRSPIDPRQSPLARKPPGIFLQQSPGIDPIASKRPAAVVVNEQVMRDGQFKPSLPRPLCKIVVIKQPNPKPLVEPADLSINGPFHEQAKAR